VNSTPQSIHTLLVIGVSRVVPELKPPEVDFSVRQHQLGDLVFVAPSSAGRCCLESYRSKFDVVHRPVLPYPLLLRTLLALCTPTSLVGYTAGNNTNCAKRVPAVTL